MGVGSCWGLEMRRRELLFRESGHQKCPLSGQKERSSGEDGDEGQTLAHRRGQEGQGKALGVTAGR